MQSVEHFQAGGEGPVQDVLPQWADSVALPDDYSRGELPPAASSHCSLQARHVVRCMREHDTCQERRVIWQGAGRGNRSGRGWPGETGQEGGWLRETV